MYFFYVKEKLWEAIKDYTEACNGDTSVKTASSKKLNAVLKVEQTIEKLQIPNILKKVITENERHKKVLEEIITEIERTSPQD